MSPEEIAEAERLAKVWHNGDNSAWPSLKAMIKAQILEKTRILYEDLSPGDQKRVFGIIMQIFEKSVATIQCDLEYREGFDGYCAYAIRRVLVELFRWIQIQPEHDSLRHRLKTTKFFTQSYDLH